MTMTQSPGRTTTSAGEALIGRLMKGDWAGADALLSADVAFRAVTPKKFFELSGRTDVIEQLQRWFAAGWREALVSFEDCMVENRPGMRYRVRWSDEYGQRFVFEQQVYYAADDSGITWLELVCSGHVPVQ